MKVGFVSLFLCLPKEKSEPVKERATPLPLPKKVASRTIHARSTDRSIKGKMILYEKAQSTAVGEKYFLRILFNL